MVQRGVWQGDLTGLGDLVDAAEGNREGKFDPGRVGVGSGALWTSVQMTPGKGWVSVRERVPREGQQRPCQLS